MLVKMANLMAQKNSKIIWQRYDQLSLTISKLLHVKLHRYWKKIQTAQVAQIFQGLGLLYYKAFASTNKLRN